MATFERCDCHKKHEEKFHTIEEIQHDRKQELRDIWLAIHTKVSMSLFLLLVMLMVGNLAFQWGIYVNTKDLDKKIAVIETQLSDNETRRLKRLAN